MKVPELLYFEEIKNIEGGCISIVHLTKEIPFDIKRVFWTYDTPIDVIRGKHAHKSTYQVLIAVSGRIDLETLDAYGNSFSFTMDSPTKGVLIPPNFWHTIKYSKGAIQLILASSEYNEEDYIRNFDDFKLFWSKNKIN